MLKYFQTKGRINRTEFLIRSVTIFMLALFSLLILGEDSSTYFVITFCLFTVYLIQCAKRYHDLNMRGINGFVWWIVPVVNLFFFFQLYLARGTKGSNKYGEPSNFIFGIKKPAVIMHKPLINQMNLSKPGEFTARNYPVEDREKKFYFYRYSKPDGEWIEKGESICVLKIGESTGFMFKSSTVIATQSGYLEWTVEEGRELEEKIIFYKLHEKGQYP